MIIDDDELDRLVLQHYIKPYENIEIVASFDSAEKAIPVFTFLLIFLSRKPI
jgi:DNA-binding NarL/FixJ family response regulator